MRKLLTLLLFYPMLVSANQISDKPLVIENCVYYEKYSVCFHGDSYMVDGNVGFSVHKESNDYNMKGSGYYGTGTR